MTTQSDTVPNFNPPAALPKINWDELKEDREIADAPKIDLTPIDLDPPKVSDKPTEEQIDSIKPLLWVGAIAAVLIGFSFLQGGKTVSTEIQSAPPQVQAQGLGTGETEQPVKAIATKPAPMPERDPDKLRIGILLLSNLSEGKNAQDQLVEARASFHRLQNQQLSQRNPQDYAMYLSGQREKVNIALQNQVRVNQTTLIGTEEQVALASKLLIESQAITLEEIRLKVAKGELTDIPDELRSRLIPNAVSPYVQIGVFARDSDNIGTLNKMLLLADREQEMKRVAAMEAQRLEAAQNTAKPQTQVQPQTSLPVPKKEVKR